MEKIFAYIFSDSSYTKTSSKWGGGQKLSASSKMMFARLPRTRPERV